MSIEFSSLATNRICHSLGYSHFPESTSRSVPWIHSRERFPRSQGHDVLGDPNQQLGCGRRTFPSQRDYDDEIVLVGEHEPRAMRFHLKLDSHGELSSSRPVTRCVAVLC